MSKLNNKSKKGIIIGVVAFITASTIIGLASGVTVSKQNNDKKQSSELLAKKTETITKINQLPELKNEQITKYTNDVNNAKTINQVDKVLANAIASNNANKTTKVANSLLDKKQTIKNEVDALVDLTNQQKQIFKKLIDQADSKQKVDSILNDAKNQQQSNKALEELKKAKSQVIEQINALTNLTNEQKTNFKIQINQAKTIDMAQSLLKEANQLNETNKQTQIQKTEELKNKKNQATNTINQLSDLTSDQKTDYINQINTANSIQSIDLVLKNANKQNEDNRTKQLNNSVSSNGDQNTQSQNNTSQGQNNNKPILNNESPNDQDLEKQKLEQERKEILNRYNDFVKTIEDYIEKELSDQKYNELKTNLEKVIAETQPIVSNSSTTKEQLEQAIEKLTTVKKDVENKKLDIVKENAKESIERLSNLEKAKKDEYKQRVVDANSENDINLILEETKSDDEKSKALKIQAEKEKEEQAELNKKKDDAINKINMFSSLDKTRLETFTKEIQKINDTKQAEQVNNILNEAEQENQKNKTLNEQKETAKNKISEFSYLNLGKQEEYKQQISSASDEAKVDEILKRAEAENKNEESKILNKKKEESRNKVLEFGSEEPAFFDKAFEYYEKIGNAKTLNDVEKILTQAQEEYNAVKSKVS